MSHALYLSLCMQSAAALCARSHAVVRILQNTQMTRPCNSHALHNAVQTHVTQTHYTTGAMATTAQAYNGISMGDMAAGSVALEVTSKSQRFPAGHDLCQIELCARHVTTTLSTGIQKHSQANYHQVV